MSTIIDAFRALRRTFDFLVWLLARPLFRSNLELIFSIAEPTRNNLHLLERAERCGKFNLPFYSNNFVWAVTKIDIENNSVKVYGVRLRRISDE